MVGHSSRGYVRPLQSLLVTGTFGQLTDADLLERFIHRADGEAAWSSAISKK